MKRRKGKDFPRGKNFKTTNTSAIMIFRSLRIKGSAIENSEHRLHRAKIAQPRHQWH
jgi:hypothetical protein